MEKLYSILGSGGFAKEVYLLLKNHDVFKEQEFIGFISNDSCLKSIQIGDESFAVINENQFFKDYPSSNHVSCFIGVGTPKIIEKISSKFSSYNFPNLMAHGANLDSSIKIGRGNIITSGAQFTVDITVGSFNIFNLNTTIGHDSHIGSFNVINPLCAVSGGVLLGDRNLLGTGSTILQYTSIGDDNIIGGNGLLNKNITNNKVMVGVPCKELIKKKQQ